MLLDASSSLRVGELLGLKWEDVDFEALLSPDLRRSRALPCSSYSARLVRAQDADTRSIHPMAEPGTRAKSERYCERLVGTMRRECLNWVIPLNEKHLGGFLREWVTHYNAGTTPRQPRVQA